MARNEDIEVYGIPEVYTKRYNHNWTVRRKTSGNVGDIIPMYCRVLVQPGDTLSISHRTFLRLTTSLFPSMDNLDCQVFAFAEDWQNTWSHTKEFWGEDEATPFEELTEYTVPQIVIKPSDVIAHDDIIHHLSIPQMEANKGAIKSVTRTENIEVEALSYRGYLDIYNRYFRDQNYIPKYEFSTGDEDTNYSNLTQKKLLKAARHHDYFAGAPEPQKGQPELLPIGKEAPVAGNGMALGFTTGSGRNAGAMTSNQVGGASGVILARTGNYGGNVGATSSGNGFGENLIAGITTDPTKSGLTADLTNTIGATINALRLITTTQQIKEELMWYGSRFEEIIFSQWGVSVNPMSMRIPEYLGSERFSLNMDTVLQTSSTDSESPQGNAAGYSVTIDEGHLFTKSFTTWQIVYILLVVRQDHTYSYGVARQHLKKRKYDFFWQKFAGLGAQARYKNEIALTGTSTDNDVWNFAPAWREYTSDVDRATGLMVPGVQDSLANYTYNDEYSTVPNSGEEWINETPAYVDRTLVVPSTTTDQLMIDQVLNISLTSVVPNYKLPGLDKL